VNKEQEDERLEIQVLQSDSRDLSLFDRSDLFFAVLYGVLFLWGLVLTLISL
jgi:hypothetical protein